MLIQHLKQTQRGNIVHRLCHTQWTLQFDEIILYFIIPLNKRLCYEARVKTCKSTLFFESIPEAEQRITVFFLIFYIVSYVLLYINILLRKQLNWQIFMGHIAACTCGLQWIKLLSASQALSVISLYPLYTDHSLLNIFQSNISIQESTSYFRDYRKDEKLSCALLYFQYGYLYTSYNISHLSLNFWFTEMTMAKQ